jgi:hypothetical protein
LLLSLNRCVGASPGSLVVARVDNQACLGIPGRCVTTDISTHFLVAHTSLLLFTRPGLAD